MEPPLRSFVKSMTAKEGLESSPDRLFVQEYFLANYFASQRIPLTLPAICRIILLAI